MSLEDRCRSTNVINLDLRKEGKDGLKISESNIKHVRPQGKTTLKEEHLS